MKNNGKLISNIQLLLLEQSSIKVVVLYKIVEEKRN